MKIASLLLAGLAAATLVPVAADAQRTVVHERTVVRGHDRFHHATRRVCRTVRR